MEPEDYFDENYVPSEEDFAPEEVDEKEELRKSIRRSSLLRTILYLVIAVLNALFGINELQDKINGYSAHSYVFIVLLLIFSLYFAYQAYVYYRVRRASTAAEMKHHLHRQHPNDFIMKTLTALMALGIGAGVALLLADKNPWYVNLLIFIAVTAVIFFVVQLGSGNEIKRLEDEDIERLQELENE